MNNDLVRVSCPYFGLQPATENEAQYFFGRENDLQIIKINLYGQPLTVLYGASGVGKSSLLLAGVVPQLRRPNQVIVVFRHYEEEDIAASLKRAVLEAMRESIQGDPPVDLSLPLDEFLLGCSRAVRGPIFLIFDQFESYFLHHPPSLVTDAFEAQFARAINRQDIDVHLLLSLREDRLSNLDRFQGRINSFQNMLSVEHMTRASAAEAILRPLSKYNELQPPGQQFRVEDGLVEELLVDVSCGQVALGGWDARTSGKVETPSLQLALVTLWKEEATVGSRVLRLETYRNLGGAERIVGTHVGRLMEEFNESDRQLAAHMFLYLVTPTGTKVAHTAEDLATYTGGRVENVERVLEKLCAPGVRILHAVAALPGQPDMARYEIFHDVLGPAILEWQMRYNEQEARQAALVREAELRQVERAKRLRQTVIVMTIAILALAGATAYAFKQRAEKERERAEAVRQRGEKEEERAEANRQRAKAEEERAGADQQRLLAQNSKQEAVEAKEKAEAAEKQLKESLQAEQLAKAEAERRAKDANEQKRLAEIALAEKEIALAEKEKARAYAEKKQKEADENRDSAEKALTREKDALTREKDAWEREKEALNQAQEALAAEQASAKMASEATALIKQIDESAPFSGGVIRSPVPLLNAAFRPDLNSVVTSDESGKVLFWKTKDVTNLPQDQLTTRNEQAVPSLPPSRGIPRLTALSSEGGLAAIAESETVYVWEPKAGSRSGTTQQRVRPLRIRVNTSGKIRSLAVTSSHGRKFVAAGTENGWVFVWNLDQCDADQSGCDVVSEKAHVEVIYSIDFSPDGRFIATASGAAPEKKKDAEDRCESSQDADNTAKVWEVSWDGSQVGGRLLPIKTLKGHRCRINSVAFNHPDTGASHNPKNNKKILRVVTASDDGTARTWNVLRIMGSPNETVKWWKEVDTDTYTMNVYEAPRVRNWLFRQPVKKFFSFALGLKEINTIQVPIYTAVFSPVNDNIIVTSGEEGALRVWDVPSSSTVRILQGHYGSIRSVAFSEGGQYVISASDDKTVRLWSVCRADDQNNARRSVIANLTTAKARDNLKTYCDKVKNETLPK